MKKIIFLLMLFSLNNYALEIEVDSPTKGKYTLNANEVVSKSISEIKEVILDIENACETGCRYQLPSVSRAEIVKVEDAKLLYTWTEIKDFLSAKYFTKTEISENTITFTTPDKTTIKELEKLGREHDPLFHTRTGVWKLKDNGDGTTQVQFEMTMLTKKGLVNMAASKVLKGMKKSVSASYKNLDQ